MLGYYFSLALRSLRATPVLSVLMVAAIAVGVSAYMTVLTLNYMMSRNPLKHKDDLLYAVQLDSGGPNTVDKMPRQLSYRDASALLRSDIPRRQVAMHRFGFTVALEGDALRPYVDVARVTTRDFFALFNVPFLYGGTWSSIADQSPERVMVLSKATNNKLFAGENSVGKQVSLDGEPFTVVGVIDYWNPIPRVYDPITDALQNTEGLFIPFGLHRQLEIFSWGYIGGLGADGLGEHEAFLQSEATWIQYWVELDNSAAKVRYENFLKAYIQEAKLQGRFQRPLKFALNKPSQWLLLNEALEDKYRVLQRVALAFLLICILNAVALLLTKFLRKAPEAGVRRALGASRRAIFVQHMSECIIIGVVGGVCGICIALASIRAIRYLAMGVLDTVAAMDWAMMFSAIGVAICASLLAGLYPAWRISRTSPSLYLKTQ